MKTPKDYKRGRGAQINPPTKYINKSVDNYYDDLETEEDKEDLASLNPKTKYIEVHPKTIVNKVDSPDVGPAWSLNPYQGCEHGCIYCYARNTHEYWDFSAGADFEQNIHIKKNAPELLRKTLNSKKWEPEAIMLAGNTDIYQPAERKFKITRQLLQVFWDMRHPVGIITKNCMIERDIDILTDLARERLVSVVFSLTTLDEELKRVMEPRTSSARQILRAITRLSSAGIPVSVNVAPIIPAVNDEGIFDIVKAVADAGAWDARFIVVRLNGAIGVIFEDWLRKNFPDRAEKVLNRIKSMHDGKLNDSRFGTRMKGEGIWAETLKNQFTLARQKYFGARHWPGYNYELYKQRREGQLRLF
jgi:DNA repair photolyase